MALSVVMWTLPRVGADIKQYAETAGFPKRSWRKGDLESGMAPAGALRKPGQHPDHDVAPHRVASKLLFDPGPIHATTRWAGWERLGLPRCVDYAEGNHALDEVSEDRFGCVVCAAAGVAAFLIVSDRMSQPNPPDRATLIAKAPAI